MNISLEAWRGRDVVVFLNRNIDAFVGQILEVTMLGFFLQESGGVRTFYPLSSVASVCLLEAETESVP